MALLTSVAAGVAGAAGFPWGPNGVTRVDAVIDFSKALGAGGVAGAVGMAADDILPVINVPAGSFVRCAVQVVTPTVHADARSIDVGDGADVDGYVDGADTKTAGRYANAQLLQNAAPGAQVAADTVIGYSFGKYYATADTIDIKAITAIVTGIVRVSALIHDINC